MPKPTSAEVFNYLNYLQRQVHGRKISSAISEQEVLTALENILSALRRSRKDYSGREYSNTAIWIADCKKIAHYVLGTNPPKQVEPFPDLNSLTDSSLPMPGTFVESVDAKHAETQATILNLHCPANVLDCLVMKFGLLAPRNWKEIVHPLSTNFVLQYFPKIAKRGMRLVKGCPACQKVNVRECVKREVLDRRIVVKTQMRRIYHWSRDDETRSDKITGYTEVPEEITEGEIWLIRSHYRCTACQHKWHSDGEERQASS